VAVVSIIVRLILIFRFICSLGGDGAYIKHAVGNVTTLSSFTLKMVLFNVSFNLNNSDLFMWHYEDTPILVLH
jgi:hypothetical protein